MNRLILVCPIDGLSLAETKPEFSGLENIMKHVHLRIDVEATCPNGHRWTLHEEIGLVRVVEKTE